MARRGPKVRTGANARKGGAVVDWSTVEPPAELPGPALAEWHRLVGLLRHAGTLERTDPRLVELYAVNYDLLCAAREKVDAEGVTVRSATGMAHLHPAVSVINQATIRLRGLIADLGLAPASSRHSGLPPAAKGEDRADPWNGLIAVG